MVRAPRRNFDCSAHDHWFFSHILIIEIVKQLVASDCALPALAWLTRDLRPRHT